MRALPSHYLDRHRGGGHTLRRNTAPSGAHNDNESELQIGCSVPKGPRLSCAQTYLLGLRRGRTPTDFHGEGSRRTKTHQTLKHTFASYCALCIQRTGQQWQAHASLSRTDPHRLWDSTGFSRIHSRLCEVGAARCHSTCPQRGSQALRPREGLSLPGGGRAQMCGAVVAFPKR